MVGIRPSPHDEDLTTGFPEDETRFLAKGEGMAYYEGVVHQEGGKQSFLHASEDLARMSFAELFEHQPAQYQGRSNWEHWDSANPIKLPSFDQTGIRPLAETLSTVKPRSAFLNSPDQRLGTRTWKQHCDDLWGLFKDLYNSEWTSNFHLMPFLQMAAYGMGDVVAVANDGLKVSGRITTNKKHWSSQSNHLLAEKVDCVKTQNKAFGFSNPVEWKKAMYNKRLFIGMVNFNTHWTSFIFDRALGHFYHYDTLEHDRIKRFRQACLGFREALANAGLPYDFNVYGMPLSPQVADWECGYLSVYVLFLNLRGMIGLEGESLRKYWAPILVNFDEVKEKATEPFQLRHRDWVHSPWTKTKADEVDQDLFQEFVSVAILDELGMRDVSCSIESEGINLGTNEFRDVHHLDANSAMPSRFMYTDLGGLQLACWKPRPYAHFYNKHRIVVAKSDAPTQIRQTRPMFLSAPQYVALPDQLIKRYQEKGYTIDNSTPQKLVESEGTTSAADGPIDLDDGKLDKARLALMKESLKVLPPIPEGMQPLLGRESLVNMMRDVSMSDLFRLGEEVGAVPSTSSGKTGTDKPTAADKEKAKKDAAYKRWLKKGEEPTRRSSRLAGKEAVSDPDAMEVDRPVGPANAKKPVKSKKPEESKKKRESILSEGDWEALRVRGMPLIADAEIVSVDSNVVTGSRRSFDQTPLSTGAIRMTREARDRLELTTVPGRMTQYLPGSDTWASYVPSGMMVESQWEDIIRSLSKVIVEDKTDQVKSRTERMEERNKRRG